MGEPSPCPVCRLGGGFHDTDDLRAPSAHRDHQVPSELVRLGNKALRRQRRANG